MGKMLLWVIFNAVAILLIVYVDMVIWASYGPFSDYQDFPVILLALIPVMLIAFPLLRKKLPRTG